MHRYTPTPYTRRFGRDIDPALRVVVTGGSGFIGTNLVDFYHQAGATVINIDKAPPRYPEHRPLWREIDITDGERYVQAVREFEPDLFFHLAARADLDERDDISSYDANIGGVKNTIAAVEGLPRLRRLIVTSTQLVCHPTHRPRSDTDYCPHTLYGQSKVLTEKIVRGWESPTCPWVLVRPTSIWGPWFREPYRSFFLAINRRRYVHQRGVDPLRSFGYVGNVIYEYHAVATAPADQVDRRTFYLADLAPTRVRDWAETIRREMGAPRILEVPLTALKLAARAGDALQRLGWQHPPMTSFRLSNLTSDSVQDLEPLAQLVGPVPYAMSEGVAHTVQWMREEGSL